MRNFIELEKDLHKNIDLLKIAKSYCDSNYEKSDEITTLGSLLELIIKKQADVIVKLSNQ